MNITFDVTKAHALNLGQQKDHNVTTVTFTGFVPEDTVHTVYIKIEGVGMYPLLDMSFPVQQAFTLKDGIFKGQLVEIASDMSIVKNSKVFNVMVKPSVDEDKEIVDETPDMDLWFTNMSELYQTVSQKLDNGEFNGKSAYEIAVEYGYVGTEEEWIEWVQNKITYEKIVEELGYTPANEEDVPHVYEWALQETKPTYTSSEVGALPSDTFIPKSISDLEDAPVLNQFITDTVNNLNNLELGKLDIPTNTGNIGQVLTKTDEGSEWAPIDFEGNNYVLLNTLTLNNDTLTVSCSTDSQGRPLNLKSIVASLSNPSGLNGGSNAICYSYDSSGNVIGNMPIYFYANASVTRAYVGVSINGFIVDMHSVGWTDAAPYSPVNKSVMSELESTSSISKIELTGNGNSFRRGTVIKIYGVRNV